MEEEERVPRPALYRGYLVQFIRQQLSQPAVVRENQIGVLIEHCGEIHRQVRQFSLIIRGLHFIPPLRLPTVSDCPNVFHYFQNGNRGLWLFLLVIVTIGRFR